jgi:hypothetical protein
MFYQPDKKLTQVILTNFHGADLYAIARALYAAIPDFTCGNKKDDKINVCFMAKKLMCTTGTGIPAYTICSNPR